MYSCGRLRGGRGRGRYRNFSEKSNDYSLEHKHSSTLRGRKQVRGRGR